jgi:hypothetical protein
VSHPEQLQWEPVPCPTIAEYLPTVTAAAGPGARRTYESYWRRITAAWGDQRLDQITPSWIEVLLQQSTTGVRRRNARAYAGHTDTATGSTATYIRGQLHGIATALAALTREPHPLAVL